MIQLEFGRGHLGLMPNTSLDKDTVIDWALAIAPKKHDSIHWTPIGTYSVYAEDDGDWRVFFHECTDYGKPEYIGDAYPSSDAAKEAAQADYDTRQKEPAW